MESAIHCFSFSLHMSTLFALCRPLLYGLHIKEEFEVLNSYQFQSKDYQVSPGSVWNYAVRLRNDSRPDQDLSVVFSGLEVGVPPFSLRGSPITITAQVSPAALC